MAAVSAARGVGCATAVATRQRAVAGAVAERPGGAATCLPLGLAKADLTRRGGWRARTAQLGALHGELVSSTHLLAATALPRSRRRVASGGSERSSHAGAVGMPAEVRCSVSAERPPSQPRFIQHKQEAFWFYRFLSIVYDHIVNPGHWTEDMREEALEPADLSDRELKVVDVGGGTGFCTLGIVKHVDGKNVTLLDQSPHQLEKARQKKELADVTIIEGDAEELPFATDYADRYVSAGSIEYWPDPQRGIAEAYRVVKKGGKACIIGPVHPTHPVSRFMADTWMLFPKEEEYVEWFTKAGFKDVQLKRIGPKWYRGCRKHGLIMGCSVTGVKEADGESPLKLGPKAEELKRPMNIPKFLFQFILGTMAGIYYALLPIYMWLKDQLLPKSWSFD
ncbi:hypothetical protein CBR_g22976 [Chara braunii]|uniref:MPBQ/MBSQ family SAM-binding methyltransferase profile domain-containing protein n=1 Tax=Chara braunii TaxID=69332 RepID=A0A388L383_CHABU|nr:hypothetical protein CBR_g22976 [Chara braunii]|eukprot:GBG76760.1 hypothetical protein CBR_g22976 [Chara braunii]